MSQRHRNVEAALPIPKADLRAHAHNERHRIHSELHSVATQVSGGSPPEDLHEPGPAWRSLGRRTDRVKQAEDKRPRHWTLKMWKRRSATRRQRAAQMRMVDE